MIVMLSIDTHPVHEFLRPHQTQSKSSPSKITQYKYDRKLSKRDEHEDLQRNQQRTIMVGPVVYDSIVLSDSLPPPC